MIPKVFAVETGGAALWSGSCAVVVQGGLFTAAIGPLPIDILSGGDRWLEVTINGSTLSPRIKLQCVPYAAVARTLSPDSPLHVGGDATFDRAIDVAGALRVGPAGSLTVAGTTTTGALSVGSTATFAGTITGNTINGQTLNMSGAAQVGSLAASGQLTANQGLIVSGTGGAQARFLVPMVLDNVLQPQIGSSYGLAFPTGYGGDPGDAAWLRYYPSERGPTAMNLELGVGNDPNDQIRLVASGGVSVPSGGLDVAGDLTVSGTINGAVSIPDGTITGEKLVLAYRDGSAFDSRFLNRNGGTIFSDLKFEYGSGIVFRSESNGMLRNDGTNTNYWGPNPFRITNSVASFDNYAARQNWGGPSRSQPIDYFLDASDYLTIHYGTAITPVGDISATDANWLRINDHSPANICTPRIIRADGGFLVGGSTFGIDSSGNVTSPRIDADYFRDRNDTTYCVDPASSSRLKDLTVDGTLTATLNPAMFDTRYLLQTGGAQIFTGDLINNKGGNYANPLLGGAQGLISTAIFSAPDHYGPTSTANIYVGQSNNVYVGNKLYASFIYDRDNTAYYVDPASTSHMNDVEVAGNLTVTGTINGGAGESSLPAHRLVGFGLGCAVAKGRHRRARRIWKQLPASRRDELRKLDLRCRACFQQPLLLWQGFHLRHPYR